MGNHYTDYDYSTLPIVPTKYGMLRLLPKTFGYSERDINTFLSFEVVISPDDGGLTLPDGKTYITPPKRSIVWAVYGGIPIENSPGGDFPVKARIGSSKKLANFEVSWSENAQIISDVLLESYVNGDMLVTPEDQYLVEKAHKSVEAARDLCREAKELEQKAANRSEERLALLEEIRANYPGAARYIPFMPSYSVPTVSLG